VVFELPAPISAQGRAEAGHARRQKIAELTQSIQAQVGGALGNARTFRSIGALAADIDQKTAMTLAQRSDVKALDVDQRLFLALDTAVPLLGIDQLHALTDPIGGVRGEGGKLAVIDSGIVQVPDLQYSDGDLAEACFCQGCCLDGQDQAFGPGSANDGSGHGTQVLGAAASQGVNASVGPAPLAKAVMIKVEPDDGSISSSDIAAALDWVANEHPDTDVVNMSLGTPDTFSGECNGAEGWLDVFEEAVESVIANGTLVVASAGNGGVHTEMSAPACLSQVIAVGATYTKDYSSTIGWGSGCTDVAPSQDALACFSNVSTTTEVMAPGAFVEVPNQSGGLSDVAGTSFSAPIVSGCLVQIMAAKPDASQGALRASLSQTDVFVNTDSGEIPRLDCFKAYEWLGRIFYDSFEVN